MKLDINIWFSKPLVLLYLVTIESAAFSIIKNANIKG